jgi:hypothetical protein
MQKVRITLATTFVVAKKKFAAAIPDNWQR